VPGVVPSDASLPELEKWARAWYRAVSASFVRGYLALAGAADFVPQGREQTRAMLIAFVLERALRDVEHEIEHRPDWARIPIHGIIDLLAATQALQKTPE
jgi:maltose alpha-D-glucosyltransferase/alpha-amylase